jgi:hypothetical protein
MTDENSTDLIPAMETTMQDTPPPPVVTQEIRIVDAEGRPRILLSAKDGTPTIILLTPDGKASLTAKTTVGGHPAITLANPLAGGPTAALEVDDKGAHVIFDRPGGASAYVFLNNQGVSGTVLIDGTGKRRLQMSVAADGTPSIQRLDPTGKMLP